MKFYKKTVLFFLIFAAFEGYAQNTLDVLGLDNTTPAAGVYSLRKLSNSYVGNAIQVRRSIDNAIQDIGFTADGNLDVNSLISFVGSGDGSVSIWFDQSGSGNNAIHNTLLNQPKIVTAGVVERANGLPTITFSGSQFLVIASTAFNNDLTGCLVYKASGLNTRGGGAGSWYNMNGIFGSEQPGGTTDFAYGIYNNKFTAGNGPSDNSVAGNIIANDNAIRRHSWTRNKTSGQINLYSNGASDGTANLNMGTSSSVTSVAIGANQTFSGGQVFYNGNVSELILFAAVLSNPRQEIENNQGLYYSIYSLATQPSSIDQSVVLGGTPTSLSVLFNDPTATYQWYRNLNKSNINGTLIPGATTNSYTPLSTDLGTSYYYAVVSANSTVLVSNPSGAIKIIPAPIIWNGPPITFQKANYADYNQVQNQDVITSTVKITRANEQGLFNIATESWFGGASPSNTEWAEGTLSNYASLTYKSWQQAVYPPPSSVNKTYVVHLINENIFLELKVLSWSELGNGGGFSYSRTTACTPPSAPTASNQSFNSPATVADLLATGSNIKWYLGSSGGTALQTSTALTSATYYVTQTVNSCESERKAISVTIVSCSAPTIGSFNNITKPYFDTNYTIVPPLSNSSGVFTYTSSNLSVATISGTTVHIIGSGTTTISATQEANGNYCSASIVSELTVNAVSVLTKNGQITTSDPNYVNKNGVIGSSSGVSVNGRPKVTKSN